MIDWRTDESDQNLAYPEWTCPHMKYVDWEFASMSKDLCPSRLTCMKTYSTRFHRVDHNINCHTCFERNNVQVTAPTSCQSKRTRVTNSKNFWTCSGFAFLHAHEIVESAEKSFRSHFQKEIPPSFRCCLCLMFIEQWMSKMNVGISAMNKIHNG